MSSAAILETNASTTLLPRQGSGPGLQSVSASERHGRSLTLITQASTPVYHRWQGMRGGGYLSPLNHSPADKHQGHLSCTHTLAVSSPATPTSRVSSTVLPKRGAGPAFLFSLPCWSHLSYLPSVARAKVRELPLADTTTEQRRVGASLPTLTPSGIAYPQPHSQGQNYCDAQARGRTCSFECYSR